MDPISIKLSDYGITHYPSRCKVSISFSNSYRQILSLSLSLSLYLAPSPLNQLCHYLDSIMVDTKKRSVSQRIDYILLGLLVFEMATGKPPYEDIYHLNTVVRAILHNKMKLSIEAQHFLQCKVCCGCGFGCGL